MATMQEPRVNIRKDFWKPENTWLTVGLIVNGILILALTVLNFMPLVRDAGETPEKKVAAVQMPEFDYTAQRGWAVEQGGRYKPFETAARELMRDIHGREKLLHRDPVPIILMWMFEIDPKAVERTSQWDTVPFILCENHDIRRLIYRLQDDGELSDKQLEPVQEYGKFISPKELKDFKAKLNRVKEMHPDRWKGIIDKHKQLGETFHRLDSYTRLRDLPDPNARKSDDPLAFVALDQVKNAPWFSIGTLQLVGQKPDLWKSIMKERVQHAPQLYVKPEQLEALASFQDRVLARQGEKAIDELAVALVANREKEVKEYLQLRTEKKDDAAAQLLARRISTWPQPQGKQAEEAEKALQQHLQKLFGKEGEARVAEKFEVKDVTAALAHNLYRSFLEEAFRLAQQEASTTADAFAAFLKDRDERVVADLRTQLPGSKELYVPADPKFRMLHLTYLETRYPNVYFDAVLWQKAPLEDISRVLKSHAELGEAWRSQDAEKFNAASKAFMDTVRAVSEKTMQDHEGVYPGPDTVGDRVTALLTGQSINPPGAELLSLEQTFNRVAPFRYGWITMLGALICFVLSVAFNSKWSYRIGFIFCAISLAFQAFGFFTRIIVSGRAPVTNLYETVIWVSFMTSIFALILEAIYRKKVIALGGALVACIGLVLADNLPLALDPKISPLTPVLRSNFWLTIHVLTIVSSYAAGALAWGLGNLALLLILFSKNSRESIKTLSLFTYRALQIAVLLLAAGTFLGGWWAAYSWGRFWGWDPKETGALIALVCYVIPLHMRFIGWIKDFGLAVAAIVCFAAIMLSWWGINFWIPAGLHSYGFSSGGGDTWVAWIALINIEWVLGAALIYRQQQLQPPQQGTQVALA